MMSDLVCSRVALAVLLVAAAASEIGAQRPPDSTALLVATIKLEWSGEEPLFRVSSAVLGPDGRLFVAEREDSRVRVYNPRTGEERLILRKGSGPREVFSPCCLALTTDGFLVARDNGNGRWVGVRVGAGRDSTFVVRQFLPTGNAEFRTATRGALFADEFWVNQAARGRPGLRRIHWYDSRGHLVDSVSYVMPTWDSTAMMEEPYTSGRANGVRYAYPLFGRQTLRASSAHGIVTELNSDRYLIRVFRPDGRIITTIRREDVMGPLLTAADRAAAAAQRSIDARRLQIPVERVRFPVPERKPPIRALSFVSDTVFLVHRSVATGAANVADAYSASGRALYRLQYPATVRLFSFDEPTRTGVGVMISVDGEESVVVLQFSVPR